jgi:hypothetical protein
MLGERLLVEDEVKSAGFAVKECAGLVLNRKPGHKVIDELQEVIQSIQACQFRNLRLLGLA